MLGLKRGTVMLCTHEKEWELEAQRTIAKLKSILGAVAKDISMLAVHRYILSKQNL